MTLEEKEFHVMKTGPLTYSVNGTEYLAEFTARANSWSAIINERVYVVDALRNGVQAANGTDDTLHLIVNGEERVARVDDKRSLLRKSLGRKSLAGQGEVTICSPMPGLVVKVEVNNGDNVTKAQGLLTLEAMKMENEIRATARGRVKAIHVSTGRSVEKGESLIVIDPNVE